MDDNILVKIEIPNFITHVKLSNKRRAKYYRRGEKLPRKYLGYHYDKKGFLINSIGQKVVKNPNTVGTPNLKKINGQDFYRGFLQPTVRNKIIQTMKDFFRKELKDMKPISQKFFPIAVELEIHVPNNILFDIDNLSWVYTKTILDVLKDLDVIPEDNVQFVNKSGGCQYVKVEEDKDRKLVIIIKSNKEIVEYAT